MPHVINLLIWTLRKDDVPLNKCDFNTDKMKLPDGYNSKYNFVQGEDVST
jgi:hypothetical protein